MPANEWPDDISPVSYPAPESTGQKDDFHGTVIADPYRGLTFST